MSKDNQKRKIDNTIDQMVARGLVKVNRGNNGELRYSLTTIGKSVADNRLLQSASNNQKLIQ